MTAASAQAAGETVCLITKTDTNPFFVKMKEGATAKAEELGMTLKAFAGKFDGDHETQVQAIETCILDGAKGILLTASDTIFNRFQPFSRQAKDAGCAGDSSRYASQILIDYRRCHLCHRQLQAPDCLIGQWAKGQNGRCCS